MYVCRRIQNRTQVCIMYIYMFLNGSRIVQIQVVDNVAEHIKKRCLRKIKIKIHRQTKPLPLMILLLLLFFYYQPTFVQWKRCVVPCLYNRLTYCGDRFLCIYIWNEYKNMIYIYKVHTHSWSLHFLFSFFFFLFYVFCHVRYIYILLLQTNKQIILLLIKKKK